MVLRNNYLNGLDMSHLLEQGAAILIGFADHKALEIFDGNDLLSDAQSLRAAVYRIVLPIRPFENSGTTTSGPHRMGPPENSVSFVPEDQS